MNASGERLDKILSQHGFGSRRAVKKIIRTDVVMINGQRAVSAEIKVFPGIDSIEINGKPLILRTNTYIMMNKPQGVISSVQDKHDTTVIDILPKELSLPGLFPVGRLDKDTEGLLLITDDGPLTHSLTSPKKNINKTYFVRLQEVVTQEVAEKFLKGITIGDYICLPAFVEFIDDNQYEVLLTIQEGKYHQIKRMFIAVGNKVVYLKRIITGPLKLDEMLAPGCVRELTDEEVFALKKAVE